MKEMPTYRVLTWDTESQQFTPQHGVPSVCRSLGALRRSLRRLQEIGYPCDYRSRDLSGDPAVSVERTDQRYLRRIRRKWSLAIVAE